MDETTKKLIVTATAHQFDLHETLPFHFTWDSPFEQQLKHLLSEVISMCNHSHIIIIISIPKYELYHSGFTSSLTRL